MGGRGFPDLPFIPYIAPVPSLSIRIQLTL
jgi:hypothetical protein